MDWVSLGISTTVVGMGVVFSVLICLSFSTWLLSKIIDDKKNKNTKPQGGITVTAKASDSVAAAPVSNSKIAEGIDAKMVAAIMGAVSAACGVAQPNLKFTSIRRSNSYRSDWAASGVNTIINTRQSYN